MQNLFETLEGEVAILISTKLQIRNFFGQHEYDSV